MFVINLSSIPDCCEQAKVEEHEKVEKLLDILPRRDDSLLTDFCSALIESDQLHVMRTIIEQGQQHTSYDCHLLS